MFVDISKIDDKVKAHLGSDVTIYPLADFAKKLSSAYNGQSVMVDPMLSPVAAEALLKKGGAEVMRKPQPIQLQKAMKNKTELDGSRAAHIRDGVAMVRFLARLNDDGFAAQATEISASDLLESLRAEGERFKGLSFDTISGAGPHGAIVHYRADKKSNAPLLSGPVYLLDSGAQYQDGTTDVTRTLAVSAPSAEMKDRFTRVLKGHIQVALSLFDYGTTGDAIDAKARAALKEIGLDYAHGTGHGVGSYLSVHEGPTGLSPRAVKIPLEKGMILSNEPGFYKNGEYGIRIENLIIVVEKAGGKLGFENLTMVPIDLRLVEASLLSDDELAYLNHYHAEVREKLMPSLLKIDPKAARFLEEATRPLSKNPVSGLKKQEAPKR
jgi:Xaa-Pro aminopeptidase